MKDMKMMLILTNDANVANKLELFKHYNLQHKLTY